MEALRRVQLVPQTQTPGRAPSFSGRAFSGALPAVSSIAPAPSCLTLSNHLPLSEPQCPHLKSQGGLGRGRLGSPLPGWLQEPPGGGQTFLTCLCLGPQDHPSVLCDLTWCLLHRLRGSFASPPSALKRPRGPTRARTSPGLLACSSTQSSTTVSHVPAHRAAQPPGPCAL